MAAERRSGLAITATATAGILLVLVGFFHVVQGLVDLINGDFYGVTANWVFRFNVTTWGWLHIVGGVIALLAGFGLFTGSVLARTVAVIVAVVSTVASFMWLPYYPFWSILIIAFDLLVIWSLTAHGRDIVSG